MGKYSVELADNPYDSLQLPRALSSTVPRARAVIKSLDSALVSRSCSVCGMQGRSVIPCFTVESIPLCCTLDVPGQDNPYTYQKCVQEGNLDLSLGQGMQFFLVESVDIPGGREGQA